MATIYFLYFFGFLPSIIWLFFYLRKDSHPESNKMVLKIFFFGMLAALIALFLEKGFQKAHSLFIASVRNDSLLGIFVGGALIEEFVKYLAVWLGVLTKNSEPDEPNDIILYMIISALGFAAVENILILSNYHPILTVTKALEVMSWRFVSATILHALCSGLLGYFMVLGLFNINKKIWFVLAGLGTTSLLHGIYNFSIIKIEGLGKFIIPLLILIVLAKIVSHLFKKLKKSKGICLIKFK